MRPYFRLLNRKSVREGRARQPPMPPDPIVRLAIWTRAINHYLGSTYGVEQVFAMPPDLRIKLLATASAYNESFSATDE